MIAIERPAAAPAPLAAGEALVRAMEQAVAARPGIAGTPAERFEFDGSVYGHAEVKEALWAAQNDKCAYCEGSFRAFG